MVVLLRWTVNKECSQIVAKLLIEVQIAATAVPRLTLLPGSSSPSLLETPLVCMFVLFYWHGSKRKC